MITTKTEQAIKDRIKKEFLVDVIEITEAYPSSLLFHAHWQFDTIIGKLTPNGNLSSMPLYEEEI